MIGFQKLIIFIFCNECKFTVILLLNSIIYCSLLKKSSIYSSLQKYIYPLYILLFKKYISTLYSSLQKTIFQLFYYMCKNQKKLVAFFWRNKTFINNKNIANIPNQRCFTLSTSFISYVSLCSNIRYYIIIIYKNIIYILEILIQIYNIHIYQYISFK